MRWSFPLRTMASWSCALRILSQRASFNYDSHLQRCNANGGASSVSLGVIGHRRRLVRRRRAPLSIGRHFSFRYPCHFHVTCLRPPARESSRAPFAGYGLGTLASEFIRVIPRLKNCKKCLDTRPRFRAKRALHMWSRLLPSISPQSLKPRLLPSISRPHRTKP